MTAAIHAFPAADMRADDRALLDLLCFAAPRAAEFDRVFRLREGWGRVIDGLRNRGLVAFDSLMPSPSALADFLERHAPKPPELAAGPVLPPRVDVAPPPARERKIRAWTDDEVKAVEIADARGLSVLDLAAAMGRNYYAVCKYLENRGRRFGVRRRLAVPPTLTQILALADPEQPLPSPFALRARPASARPREPWPAEKKRTFLEALERTGSIDAAMTAVGLQPWSRGCAYRQKRRDAEFSAAWDDALKRSPYRPGRKPPAGPSADRPEPKPRPRIWADPVRQGRLVESLRRTGWVTRALRELGLKGGDQPSRITRQRAADPEFDRRCAEAIAAWKAENPPAPKAPAPRPAPRPRGWADPERQDRFIEALRQEGSVKHALRTMDLADGGATVGRIARRRRDDPEFDRRCVEAIAAFKADNPMDASGRKGSLWASAERQEAFIAALRADGAVSRALVAVSLGSTSTSGYLRYRNANPAFAARCDEAVRAWRAARPAKPKPAQRPRAREFERQPAPTSRIGAEGIDWEAARRIQKFRKAAKTIAERRTEGGRLTGIKDAGPAAFFMARAAQETQAAQDRAANPVEQAKLFLQRRGRVVYRASVVGGPEDRWVVSSLGNRVTDEQLIEEARKVAERMAA